MIGLLSVVILLNLGFDTTSTEISVVENILKLDINQKMGSMQDRNQII
jgi:hypothetical protein